MNTDEAIIHDVEEAPVRASLRWVAGVSRVEDILVSLALAIMVVLPLMEAALRRTFHVSVPSSTAIVQHMVLIVGMLGGAIAARERRLLSLSNFAESSLGDRVKRFSRVFTSTVSTLVCGFLCVAAYQFVQTERDA